MPDDFAGPIGFQHIDSAPRDGRYLRLRFRPGFGREDREEIGQWQRHDHMKAGGSWFDRHGHYISPGALFWAPTR